MNDGQSAIMYTNLFLVVLGSPNDIFKKNVKAESSFAMSPVDR